MPDQKSVSGSFPTGFEEIRRNSQIYTFQGVPNENATGFDAAHVRTRCNGLKPFQSFDCATFELHVTKLECM